MNKYMEFIKRHKFIIIFALIMIIFIWNKISVNNYNSNNILKTDLMHMIRQEDKQYLCLSSDIYKSLKDGKGREIGIIEYKANPINVHGATLTSQTITKTIRLMFMKKNGVVTYVVCPNNFLMQTTYKDYEDFKTKNNWEKSEKLGLGINAKSIYPSN